MKLPKNHLKPDQNAFAADPFGYSAFAWHRWSIVQSMAGFPVDPSRPLSKEDLKSPVLWLTQARALTQAAVIVLKGEPSFDKLPEDLKGICDSQYRAAGLMLVGYSLEVCLKAMLIMIKGLDAYSEEERKHRHHRLEQLGEFVPGLSVKDRAILRCLTHFITWAGRYPDPGSGREKDAEEIFSLSEKHQIAGRDLFHLAGRIMAHTREVIDPALG